MRILPLLIILFCGCKYRNTNLSLNTTATDSLAETMRKQLGYYFKNNDKEAPVRYLDSLRHTIADSKNPQLIGIWNAYMGAAYLFQENIDSSKVHIDKAIQIAENKKLPKLKAIAKTQLVTFFLKQNAYDSALRHGLEAIELSKGHDLPELPFLYLQLVFLYRTADDTANFRKFLFEGLKVAKDSTQIAAISSEIGRYYISHNQFDSAEHFYKNFKQFNQYATYYMDGRRHQDLAFLFLNQNKRNEAVKYMKQAIELYRKEGFSYAENYLSVGSTLAETGRLPEAHAYLDTALFIARKNHDLENISNAMFFKSTVFLNKGKPIEAYYLLDSSYIQHLQYDTLAFRNQAKDVEANTIRKLKDEQIASLNVANEAMKKISRQRLIIIGTLVLGSLLLIAWGAGIIRGRKIQSLLKEVELEQQMLRSLIEPHFLFNLLGNIESNISHGNINKASNYLKKAAKLIQLILENARQSFVPLTADIEVLECYLDLQKDQLGDIFEYHIEISPEIEQGHILIPPMLLQPFAENAILHGFRNLSDEKGVLRISFKQRDDILQCQIEDNGNGLNNMMGEKKFRLHSTPITSERLQLLGKRTGKKTKLEIIDKSLANEGSGVRVIIDLPFIREI